MPTPARRDFLKVAGAGAVAAGAVTVAPGSAEAAPAAPKGRTPSIVAHVADARTGKVLIMVGASEITVTDKALAAKLAHHAQAASRQPARTAL